jgi:hypothetical protein
LTRNLETELSFQQEDIRRSRESSSFSALRYQIRTREGQNTLRYSFWRHFTAGLAAGAGTSMERTNTADYDFYSVSPFLLRSFEEKGRVRAEYTWNRVAGNGPLYYQMAHGFAQGVTHQWTLAADYRIGENLTLNMNYFGRLEEADSSPFQQAGMDLRAFF